MAEHLCTERCDDADDVARAALRAYALQPRKGKPVTPPASALLIPGASPPQWTVMAAAVMCTVRVCCFLFSRYFIQYLIDSENSFIYVT